MQSLLFIMLWSSIFVAAGKDVRSATTVTEEVVSLQASHVLDVQGMMEAKKASKGFRVKDDADPTVDADTADAISTAEDIAEMKAEQAEDDDYDVLTLEEGARRFVENEDVLVLSVFDLPHHLKEIGLTVDGRAMVIETTCEGLEPGTMLDVVYAAEDLELTEANPWMLLYHCPPTAPDQTLDVLEGEVLEDDADKDENEGGHRHHHGEGGHHHHSGEAEGGQGDSLLEYRSVSSVLSRMTSKAGTNSNSSRPGGFLKAMGKGGAKKGSSGGFRRQNAQSFESRGKRVRFNDGGWTETGLMIAFKTTQYKQMQQFLDAVNEKAEKKAGKDAAEKDNDLVFFEGRRRYAGEYRERGRRRRRSVNVYEDYARQDRVNAYNQRYNKLSVAYQTCQKTYWGYRVETKYSNRFVTPPYAPHCHEQHLQWENSRDRIRLHYGTMDAWDIGRR